MIRLTTTGAALTLLGGIGLFVVPIGSHMGSTFDDGFYGLRDPGGIEAIKLSNSSGGIEVDHVQFEVVSTIPEPCSSGLRGLALTPAMAHFSARRPRRATRP